MIKLRTFTTARFWHKKTYSDMSTNICISIQIYVRVEKSNINKTCYHPTNAFPFVEALEHVPMYWGFRLLMLGFVLGGVGVLVCGFVCQARIVCECAAIQFMFFFYFTVMFSKYNIYIYIPLDEILRPISKIVFRAFYTTKIIENYEKREKYKRGLNPDSIRSFYQF